MKASGFYYNRKNTAAEGSVPLCGGNFIEDYLHWNVRMPYR